MSHDLSSIWVTAKRAAPDDIRVRLRTATFRSPTVGKLWWSVDPQNRRNRIGATTRFVIDGYPRSANTYTATAFRLANPTVEVRALLHTPLAIAEARRRGIPALLLVRRPDQAIASYLQLLPRLSPATAIRMYCEYYEASFAHLHWVVVADFTQVTADLGGVIRRCNERYGTTFREFAASPQEQSAVKTQIRELWGGHLATPLPSAHRRTATELIAGWTRADRAQLCKASHLYESFTEFLV